MPVSTDRHNAPDLGPAPATTTGIVDRIGRFARERLCGRDELRRPDAFPFDLWQEMAAEGFLALGAPRAFGGLDADPATQMAAAEALARGGRNLGLAVAWQSHNTLTRFFFDRFGSPEQRARWLPDLAAGRITPAVAISEPGVGAHPKHLSTTATLGDNGWVLNGAKAYVTNGPIAGIFVILAVTACEGVRKRFSAFLVPRDTPGLSLTAAGAVDALHPVGHCGLRLTECRVGPDAVLGRLGTAYDDMARPLRDHEDLLQVGTLTGAMLAILDAVGEAVAQDGLILRDEAKEVIGMMATRIAAVRALGRAALAAAKDDRDSGPALLLAARRSVQDFLAELDGLPIAAERTPVLADLRRDLGVLAGIARQVARLRLRALGEAALRRPD